MPSTRAARSGDSSQDVSSRHQKSSSANGSKRLRKPTPQFQAASHFLETEDEFHPVNIVGVSVTDCTAFGLNYRLRIDLKVCSHKEAEDITRDTSLWRIVELVASQLRIGSQNVTHVLGNAASQYSDNDTALEKVFAGWVSEYPRRIEIETLGAEPGTHISAESPLPSETRPMSRCLRDGDSYIKFNAPDSRLAGFCDRSSHCTSATVLSSKRALNCCGFSKVLEGDCYEHQIALESGHYAIEKTGPFSTGPKLMTIDNNALAEYRTQSGTSGYTSHVVLLDVAL